MQPDLHRLSTAPTIDDAITKEKDDSRRSASTLQHKGSDAPVISRSAKNGIPKDDPKNRMLTLQDAYDKTGFGFSTKKKWMILSVIFIVQTSMNFNASVFAGIVPDLSHEFGITEQTVRVAQMVFLIAYAFGCEAWAPWSEELGRQPILQASLFFVNVWQILGGLAPNFGTIVVARFLGGLSSAGGSVTLGMVADMWEPADQQFAVAYVVLSSVGGSVVGPIVGGFMTQYLTWRWNFWIQLMFGVFTQSLHAFVPETCTSVLLDKEAKRRRKAGEDENIYGPNEIKGTIRQRMTFKEVVSIWIRPFKMFVTEPIVLCLSLLSGFSDALIFTFLESYTPVFQQWGFNTYQLGLAFVPLLVGYVIAYLSFMPFFRRQQAYMAKNGPYSMAPERRLYWLLYTAPLEAIGLFGFAWCSLGPEYGIPWIAPLLFSALVGIANYAIYMATIDYMVASYGPWSASATGGNGFARDFLAGIAAMYSVPFYENIPGKYRLAWPSTILAILAVVVTIPVFIFYWKGPALRARSKYATELEQERFSIQDHRVGRKMQEREDEEKAALGRVAEPLQTELISEVPR